METTLKYERNELEDLKEAIKQIIKIIEETAKVIISLVSKLICKISRFYKFNKKYSKLIKLANSKKRRTAKKNRNRLIKLINDEHLFKEGKSNE